MSQLNCNCSVARGELVSALRKTYLRDFFYELSRRMIMTAIKRGARILRKLLASIDAGRAFILCASYGGAPSPVKDVGRRIFEK